MEVPEYFEHFIVIWSKMYWDFHRCVNKFFPNQYIEPRVEYCCLFCEIQLLSQILQEFLNSSMVRDLTLILRISMLSLFRTCYWIWLVLSHNCPVAPWSRNLIQLLTHQAKYRIYRISFFFRSRDYLTQSGSWSRHCLSFFVVLCWDILDMTLCFCSEEN